MKEFYTDVQVYGSNILYRGYENGQRVQKRVPYKPVLFSKTTEESPYKSLYGDNLKQHTFQSIKDARDFVKEFKEVSNQKLFGNNNFQYQYIHEKYKGLIDFDFTQIKKISLDIETSTDGRFPNPKEALFEVLLVTIIDFETKKMWTFGSRPSTRPNYHLCKDEYDLLKTVIRFIRTIDPDIITGWNVEKFDIAYLGSRSTMLLGEEEWSKISPWNSVRAGYVGDDKDLVWNIEGVAVLDYLDLYKKFTYTNRESYKLDHIAAVELGKRKLEMPCDSFVEFCSNPDYWDTFTEYNQIDTQLVDEFETKLGLLYLAAAIAYLGKVNLTDVYSPVKTWENYILSTLLEENKFAPLKSASKSDRTIAGAWVKDVKPGFYSWVASADAASLYPSIIIALNMSPETLQNRMIPVTVDGILESDDVLSDKFSVAANGSMYSKDRIGILPRLMKHCLDGRKEYKKKMLSAKQSYNDTGNIEYKKEADKCGVMQLALKIFANSGYGGLANEYFLFFDHRIAEGITLTGQLLLKTTERHLNSKLNGLLKTEGVDYAFYGDTDSVYFSLDKVANKFFSDQPKDKVVKALVKLCEQKIIPYIDEACNIVHTKLNALNQSLVFKLEAIADSGFWVAKKKYALRYFYNEGVWYDNGELKVMGIEIVRSSTPSMVRESLKQSLQFIFDNEIRGLRDHIHRFREQFRCLQVEDISFPRSANNLKEYSDSSTIYRKGCPIAVRGALVYNHHIMKNKLDKKYPLIQEGNKVKFIYIKMPNPLHENVIAYPEKLPVDLGLDKYVDVDLQFQKTFIDPLDIIMKAIGWELEEKNDLMSLFG